MSEDTLEWDFVDGRALKKHEKGKIENSAELAITSEIFPKLEEAGGSSLTTHNQAESDRKEKEGAVTSQESTSNFEIAPKFDEIEGREEGRNHRKKQEKTESGKTEEDWSLPEEEEILSVEELKKERREKGMEVVLAESTINCREEYADTGNQRLGLEVNGFNGLKQWGGTEIKRLNSHGLGQIMNLAQSVGDQKESLKKAQPNSGPYGIENNFYSPTNKFSPHYFSFLTPHQRFYRFRQEDKRIVQAAEDGFVGKKRSTKFSARVGEKLFLLTESRHCKNEIVGKIKEPGFMGHSPKDGNTNFTSRSPLMNDRGRTLRREHSDLELGEFREPIPDETSGSKKQFERENSFKNSENKPASSEYWNSDSSKGKPSNKITSDSRKQSSPYPNIVPSGFPDGSLKSKTPERYADDLTRSHQRTVQSQPQQHQSRHIEGGTNLGTSLEAHQTMYSRVPVNAPAEQQYLKPVPPSMKEGKKQKSNAVANLNDKSKDASLTGNNDGGQKRRESSSDENSFLYSKYEKDKPGLKGPIKDSSQYKEYVQEFQEKYESYCSLNKILESYRDEFNNLGKDLEVYRGKDTKRYQDTLGEMRASFCQCGERHKRLKKIFVVLHEELKQLKQMIKDYVAKD